MFGVPSGITSGMGIFLSRAVAVSKKMLSPQTIGVPFPRPSRRVFHRKFSVSLQVTGGSACVAMPFQVGPLHCGQYLRASSAATHPAGATGATSASSSVQLRAFFIVLSSSCRQASHLYHMGCFCHSLMTTITKNHSPHPYS